VLPSNQAFSGIPGNVGDEGPANQAELNTPTRVAVDSASNVYIADSGNNVVRKVDAGGGTIHTFAGGGAGNGVQGYAGDEGPANAAQLANPTGVAVDNSGDVYIADSANDVIRLVDPSGVIHTLAGSGTPGYAGDNAPAIASQLAGPDAVAVYDPSALRGEDHTIRVPVADPGNSRVRSIAGRVGPISTPDAPCK